jgi:antitoxin component YwqK of YwqJK toxin-antitoxin module
MMNIRLILPAIALFATSAIFGQEAPNKLDASGKKQGHWIKLDENGKKMYEGNFVNNVPTGKFTYFYDNGLPWSIANFSQNGKVAHTQMFNAGGKLIGEGKYVSEKKDSVWKFYSEEGKLLSEEGYANGIKVGPSKVYYANGQVSEEKIYKAGKLDGTVKKYFENGQLKYIGKYVADKVEGKVVFYYPSGKVNAEGVYKNDLKEGPWKYYAEDGKVERTDVYVGGKMNSTDKEYISKEEQDKERKKYEQFEIKDPYQENYRPE